MVFAPFFNKARNFLLEIEGKERKIRTKKKMKQHLFYLYHKGENSLTEVQRSLSYLKEVRLKKRGITCPCPYLVSSRAAMFVALPTLTRKTLVAFLSQSNLERLDRCSN